MAILLIDDDHDLIDSLKVRVAAGVPDSVKVLTWEPRSEDGDGRLHFDKLRETNDLELVATDYDLTRQGMGGLFGSTIVDWCQHHLIPVADFSRGNISSLPKEPNLFELRISPNVEQASVEIASLWRGFRQVRSGLQDVPGVTEPFEQVRSPAAALARVLKRSHDESLFALYSTRYGGANSTLLDRIRATLSPDLKPAFEEKQAVLAYIVGHLLVNAVLRFPGPILHAEALAAYCGAAPEAAEDLAGLFAACKYDGPFLELGSYFWLECVQKHLGEWAAEVEMEPAQADAETVGEVNRFIVESRLGKELPRHPCPRCEGRNGGFWCPLTRRAVCLRPTCSVAATSWVPRGAQLCRIERDFYEEWAPILGA